MIFKYIAAILFLFVLLNKSESISLNKRVKNIPKCCPIGLVYRRHPQTGNWYCGAESDYDDKDDEYFRKSIEIQYQILQKRTTCSVQLINTLSTNSKLQVTVEGKLRINYELLVDENFCLEMDGEQNILGVFTCDDEQAAKEKTSTNEIDYSANEIQQVMETKNRVSNVFESSNNRIISKCCHYGEGLQKRYDGTWICQPQLDFTHPKDFLASKALQYYTHPTCMKTSKYYDINIGNVQNPLKFIENNLYIQLYTDYCLDRENGSDRVMIFYC